MHMAYGSPDTGDNHTVLDQQGHDGTLGPNIARILQELDAEVKRTKDGGMERHDASVAAAVRKQRAGIDALFKNLGQ